MKEMIEAILAGIGGALCVWVPVLAVQDWMIRRQRRRAQEQLLAEHRAKCAAYQALLRAAFRSFNETADRYLRTVGKP